MTHKKLTRAPFQERSCAKKGVMLAGSYLSFKKNFVKGRRTCREASYLLTLSSTLLVVGLYSAHGCHQRKPSRLGPHPDCLAGSNYWPPGHQTRKNKSKRRDFRGTLSLSPPVSLFSVHCEK